MSWHNKTISETCEKLSTNKHAGLTTKQVTERIMVHGYNRLTEKKRPNIFIRFLMQFNDFMILILLTAAGVSFFVSLLRGEADYADPLIILAIVIVNAMLGIVQENKAEKALQALKKMSAPTAVVLRDSKVSEIDAEEIVPGDVMLLEAGNIIPADGRLIQSSNLRIEEAALTGESVPVDKESDISIAGDAPIGDRRNMIFAGSSISCGRCRAVVVSTGMNTEMGKIAAMIDSDDSPETPLQKKLGETGKLLGIGALGICGLLFAIGLLRRIEPFEMFMTSVSLAVAAIPEGLPAIVTIMLAIGVQRMTKRNAVIRKLPAVETLGSASIICSDKTGTLTQNRMKIVELATAEKSVSIKDGQSKFIIKLASLCNDSIFERNSDGYTIKGDPTEKAFISCAVSMDIDKNKLEKELPRVAEIPFESSRKLMTTIHKRASGEFLCITKGAPDVLIERCTHYYADEKIYPMTSSKRKEIAQQNANMAEKALRVLGIGFNEISALPSKITSDVIEKGLVFTGLAGMIDPPREEVRDAVETCINAGIKPVMITGDHISTAVAIAKRIGIMRLGDKAITGTELSKMTQEELNQGIGEYSVFARVSPEHKVKIVKAFQSRGDVVAMTGDGINDAPALKAADIGCAMGISGTDVAKSAADMVLTDDNFATIVDAVREGRGIYANIRKAVHFLLSSNIGEIITIFTAILLGWRSPLMAIQLLWVNLVTDSLPAIALGLDPAESSVMHRKPFDNHKSMFSGGLWQRIALEGCMIGVLALLGYIVGSGTSYETGCTMAFAVLSISQLVHSFNMRTEGSIFAIDFLGNVYLVGAFIIGVLLQVSVIMIEPIAKIFKVIPLTPLQWLVVTFLCIMPIIIVELEKYFSSDKKLFPIPEKSPENSV